MVNSDGTIAISHEGSSESNVQINVSANSDKNSGDYEGITVPSGKLAGGGTDAASVITRFSPTQYFVRIAEAKS